MVNNISSALNAYQQALSRIGYQPPLQQAEPAKPVNTFQNMVQDALTSTVDSVKQAEQTTIQGLQGKADIQDVVQAIANAENALETVVAVRDTAIKAYQSIIQMTI